MPIQPVFEVVAIVIEFFVFHLETLLGFTIGFTIGSLERIRVWLSVGLSTVAFSLRLWIRLRRTRAGR
jgi:hypothetical protein